MAISGFPNDAICYILADIPGEGEFQGTGAIIGPHTILTAAHLVYSADVGATADKISVYPGFTPDQGTYNPPGALPGLQSIHTIRVNDSDDMISAQQTQSDFAVIDTSTDLSSYGAFALDPNYTSGDVVVTGYPASNDGNLTGTGGVVMQDGTLSDIRTSSLDLSPGYSGGPIRTDLYRDGAVIPAVAGTVSTNVDGMKLNQAKVRLIRHWIASDQSLYAGGSDAPRGLVPQLDGTVTGTVDAAAVSGPPAPAALPDFVFTDAALAVPTVGLSLSVDRATADLAAALSATAAGGDTHVVPCATAAGVTLAAPVAPFHPER